MPRSVASSRSFASYQDDNDEDDKLGEREAEALRNSRLNAGNSSSQLLHPTHVSPLASRRLGSARPSDIDLRSRIQPLDESTTLLSAREPRGYRTLFSAPTTPRHPLTRSHSYTHSIRRNHGRRGSFGLRLARALGGEAGGVDTPLPTSKPPHLLDDRVWYDQFTSTDWVHDSIADAYRVKALRSRKDWRGRLSSFFDGAQGWILVAIIGCIAATVAYVVNVIEPTIFDYKTGHCMTSWYYNKKMCCSGSMDCPEWVSWSWLMEAHGDEKVWADYAAYVVWVMVLAAASCLITLQTKTTISSALSLLTLDEDLGAGRLHNKSDDEGRRSTGSPTRQLFADPPRPPLVYYPAAGSGVAEVKVILSGFVLHGYLGVRTLVCKTLGLILSVASGLSIGKEGPYVHIATCVGNIACRLFSKYRSNDGKRREVLSASAAAGVAVAFGAPIGGVLFSLEEVSYYFPPKTLFRTFFCCIAAALSLRFFNPYDTGKIVLFEVRYSKDWNFFEIIAFILLGILGGATGALFIKASRVWASTFRRIKAIKAYPMLEVLIIALATGLVSFWNRYTRLPVAELLYELASPCETFTDTGTSLCATQDRIPEVIFYLCIAFVIKAILTTVTFGIKVPAGIYVPSMVVGGLLGRIVGHVVQYLTLRYPDFGMFASCPRDGSPEACVVPGVYALVAAGATMCGVTRLSVTLAVILFELTGSLEHVLPFSLGVLIAKWTADAVEPLSIYDLLTDMNSYPYLDAKVRPIFTSDLGDIVSPPNPRRFIDISISPLVPASQLRAKLEFLHVAGELDGGLPILRDGVLAGLIPAPDLEYALDRLDAEDSALCLMSAHEGGSDDVGAGHGVFPSLEDLGPDHEHDDPAAAAAAANPRSAQAPPADFTPYIDPAPVSLDVCSPMDLVFECFVKLGLRYICVLRDGRYAGMVHKKSFVRYVKEVEEGKHG